MEKTAGISQLEAADVIASGSSGNTSPVSVDTHYNKKEATTSEPVLKDSLKETFEPFLPSAIEGPSRPPYTKKEDDKIVLICERKKEDDKTKEGTFVVATLIATVTFAAGFTLPGGTFQEGENLGSAILMHNSAFQAFAITDCIAMVLSASAVLIYLFTTFEEVRNNNNRYKKYGIVATRLTMSAMVSMIIAFVTGTYAVLGASKSIGVVTLLIGLSFFLVLFILVWKGFKYIKEGAASVGSNIVTGMDPEFYMLKE